MNLARDLVRAAGGHAHLCAKVERHEAIHNLTEIIDASDVVMVARGDLGVEMGYAAITGLQKTIIHESRTRNKVVITATQMMESMITSPVPTRAEVSDVANAVMDGTDAVMLSAESAVGKHPIKAIQAMEDVIAGAEKYEITHNRMRHRAEGIVDRTEEAIAMAVMYTANHMKVRAIVALTESGTTPLWMSRARSDIPIYAFTRHEATRRRVTLYRGVFPVPFDIPEVRTNELFKAILTHDAAARTGGKRRARHRHQGRAHRHHRRHQRDDHPARSERLTGFTDDALLRWLRWTLLVIAGLRGAGGRTCAGGPCARACRRSKARRARPALSAEATIERDARGIPVITAATRADLAYATGLRARAGPLLPDGPVAPAARPASCRSCSARWRSKQDRRTRRFGFRAVARRVIEAAPATNARIIEAYARGVQRRPR